MSLMLTTLSLRSVIILSIFLSLLLTGCTKKEEAKKVNLTKKNLDKVEEAEYPPQDTVWFGLGLRPGAKEDDYILLLKYLEGATGRRFRIKFSRTHKDTVEDLGRGVTHFAAIGTLNYIIGESRYGIRYLVRGVNKKGTSETYPGIIIAYNSSVDSRTVEAVRAALLAFEPEGMHKDMLQDWDKTKMPPGFIEVDELEIEKLRVLAKDMGC